MSTLAHNSDLPYPLPVRLGPYDSKRDGIEENIPLGHISSSSGNKSAGAHASATSTIAEALPAVIYDVRMRSNAPLPSDGTRSGTGISSEILVDSATKKRMRRNELVHMGALCWMMFLVGWNDGTIGPMLPRIQDVYGVRTSSTFYCPKFV